MLTNLSQNAPSNIFFFISASLSKLDSIAIERLLNYSLNFNSINYNKAKTIAILTKSVKCESDISNK